MLDAYAGSGAIGVEALSRGAAQVIFVEAAQGPVQAIKRNLEDLQIGWGFSVHESTVESWLAKFSVADAQPFDLIVADPPYERIEPDVLEKLGMLLVEEGILGVSHSGKRPVGTLEGLEELKTRVYGDSAISFYGPRKP